MKRLEGDDFLAIKPFFDAAATVAANATCLRARCGAVIVSHNLIIGQGFNSPALNDEGQRLCQADMNTTIKPKYDKTCCIHAEWRAVLDACKANTGALTGSVLYFMRIDDNNNFTDAGKPFCTTCSRLTMEAGVSQFALYNDAGADLYPLAEYNLKSYADYVSVTN
jgi:deoxycytidylate deaminase